MIVTVSSTTSLPTAPAKKAASAAPEGSAPPAVSPSTLTSAGAVIVGAVASITVTVVNAFAELPESSVAVKVTMVSPNGSTVGASLVITKSSSTMSDTINIAITSAKPTPELLAPAVPSLSIVSVDGAMIVGAVVSSTVTEVVMVASLKPSLTVIVTSIV